MRTLFPIGLVLLVLLALPGVAVFAADLAGYGADLNGWLERTLGVSHRVALAIPAAVVMFLLPPAVVLLYFLRLKRKPVAVPSTFLWKKSVEDLHVNRLMQWIRRNVLLLLQLLALLVLIYGVLGPRLHGSVAGGRHYIIVIDNSASMSATDVPPDRLTWAKDQAVKEIEAATDADTGMVIVFSDTAEVYQSYTNNRAALRAAVERVRPTQRQTRLDEALRLAAGLANPQRSTENETVAPPDVDPGQARTYVAVEGMAADIHLFSDGKFPDVPEFSLSNLNLTFHVPPSSESDGANNVGVLWFTAERDPDDPTKVVARAVVHNYRNSTADVRPVVDVLAGGTEQGSIYDDDDTRKTGRKKPIPPKSERPDLRFTIPDLPETSDTVLRLRLEGANDAFPADDTAWVVVGVVRKARVLVVGPENRRLRDFLDAPSTKKIADVAYLGRDVLEANADPKDYLAPAREGRYDLVIFDRCGPPTADAMPAANTFFVGHPPPPYALQPKSDGPPPPARDGDPPTAVWVDGPSIRGWETRHPVMKHLRALDEVDVAEAFHLRPDLPPRSQRLVEGSENLVLLAAARRQAFTDLIQTFPLVTADGRWNTNWPLKVSYPLFMRNVLMHLGNVRDAGAEPATRPGQIKPVPGGGATELRVVKPDDGLVRLERGPHPDFQFAGTDQLGVYAARWDDPGGKGTQARRFAVNLFDPVESDIAPAAQVSVGDTTVEAGTPRRQPWELWKWPVLAGLLVLLGEWWVYNRRVQI